MLVQGMFRHQCRPRRTDNMKLEDEIVQKKFKSEHQKAMVNIVYTSNWLSALHGHHLKPFGLTQQQFNILRILRGQHPQPATIRLLTERMLDKMSNASRLVEKLRQKELVERDPCQEDRRQVNVKISQKGLELLKELDVAMEDADMMIRNGLTEEEAKELNRMLDKLRG